MLFPDPRVSEGEALWKRGKVGPPPHLHSRPEAAPTKTEVGLAQVREKQ